MVLNICPGVLDGDWPAPCEFSVLPFLRRFSPHVPVLLLGAFLFSTLVSRDRE
jgi:hypothetical protein